jgi:hypothetical protein
MPNWCDNYLTIRATKEKIDAIEAVLQNRDGEKSLLSHLYPEPDYDDPEFKVNPTYASKVTPDFGMPSWWDWRVQNWGTKWEIEVRDWNRVSDTEVTLSFDSAWSPPTGVYNHVADEYDITAYYHESGMGFCGKFTSKDGDECYEYDLGDLESIKALPSDIEDFANLIEAYHDYNEAPLDD